MVKHLSQALTRAPYIYILVLTSSCWRAFAKEQHFALLPGDSVPAQPGVAVTQPPAARPSTSAATQPVRALASTSISPELALQEAPPVVDEFSIIFWSIAAGTWTLLCLGVAWHDSQVDEDSRLLATEFVIPVAKLGGDEEGGSRLISGHYLHSPVHAEGRRRGGVGRTTSSDEAAGDEGTGSSTLGSLLTRALRSQSTFSNADLEVRQVCMPRNLWAFLVVVALGQAKVHRHDFPRALAFVITLMSSFVQLAAVSLLVYDIDPKASPWTTDPDARWKTSGMSVNYMKGVQIVFLIAALVPEVGQSLSVFQAVFLVRQIH